MERKEKLILSVTIVSHALTHVAELTFPATAALVSMEFFGSGQEYAEIGTATALSGFLFGCAALPSGWLVDKLGARRVLLLFLFGTGLSLAAMSFTPDFILFEIALASLGLFSGLYHPAGTTLISNGIREQGTAMGMHGVGGNLGLAITPFMAAAVARGAGGWRTAYLILAAPPLLAGLVILLGIIHVADSRPKKAEAGENGKRYALIPLLLLFAMVTFNGMNYRALMTFLPAYFAEKVQLDWSGLAFLSAKGAENAKVIIGGVLTTLILMVGVISQYIGGRLADRVHKETLYTTIFALTFPLLFLMSFLHGGALVIVTALFAFLYFINQPVGNAIIPTYAGPGVRGLVFGLYFFMSFGVGSISGWMAGEVGERMSLSAIFPLMSGFLLISALIGIFLVRVARKRAGASKDGSGG